MPGETEEIFQNLAYEYGIWLIPGSAFEKIGPAIYNTAMVINPDGQIVGRYRKMFPFRPYEHEVEAGTAFLVFDVPGVGRFGLSICYDMWFPETSRTLTTMGAEVLLHPVLTGTIDRDVEISLARATATMFQCFVIDINGLGAGGCGRSTIFDPGGYCLHQAGSHPELIPLEIDLAQARRQREIGHRGLGQLLKSFRDRSVDFSVYQKGAPGFDYLGTLGPLEIPARGSRAGLS